MCHFRVSHVTLRVQRRERLGSTLLLLIYRGGSSLILMPIAITTNLEAVCQHFLIFRNTATLTSMSSLTRLGAF